MSRFNRHIILSLLLFTNWAVHATEWGDGYDPIDPPVATSAPKGKIEVLEFFWYGCPHCYTLEHKLEDWLKTKPDHVVFSRVPTSFNQQSAFTAQFYYTAESLGLTKKLHKPLFKAIHVKKRKLFDKQSLIDFAVEQGVEREEFTSTWNSFGVYVKTQNAKNFLRHYQLNGVPAIGINGKYLTSGSLAGSYEKMFQIVDQLLKNESQQTVKAD